jgi:hypothetical protein
MIVIIYVILCKLINLYYKELGKSDQNYWLFYLHISNILLKFGTEALPSFSKSYQTLLCVTAVHFNQEVLFFLYCNVWLVIGRRK